MDRRTFLKTALCVGAGAVLPLRRAAASSPTLCIALLHLAAVTGDLSGNRMLVEKAVTIAAENGAAWIITPELCTCGYGFAEVIGTAWIRPQPDEWMSAICRRISSLGVTLFLARPERDERTSKLHNSVFVIGRDGIILGRHRKIQTLKVGSESWSSPGAEASPLEVQPVGKVGILICADAYAPWIARRLKAQGARILVSAAAWGPGPYGPNGEWERCTRDTGLPLLVCNRTGMDHTLDFSHAASVVAKDGRRLCSLTSESSTVFVMDWDIQMQIPVPQTLRTIHLND
jgi:N-carbamoylputrescine amidase